MSDEIRTWTLRASAEDSILEREAGTPLLRGGEEVRVVEARPVADLLERAREEFLHGDHADVGDEHECPLCVLLNDVESLLSLIAPNPKP
jgi:hypothetical protein